MDPDARDEIERLAEQAGIEPQCGFTLTGYGEPRPCLLPVHPPGSVHDCGGVLVAA